MIIDSNLVLFEGNIETKQGEPIAVNALQIPGKAEAMPMLCRCTEALKGATALTLTLQQAESEDGSFSDVEGASTKIIAKDCIVGKRIGWGFLPRAVEYPWLRLNVLVEGSPSAGKLFCALVREEDSGYEAKQYVK